jgi:hypothetical protein
MQKFMCIHTLPPNQVTRAQAEELADAAQHDETIRGYRSFMNLSEGKVICVMESGGRDAVTAWFRKMKLPVDSITPVELEGDRGRVEDVTAEIPIWAGA